MQWIDFKANILRIGFELCPNQATKQGFLKYLEACYSENTNIMPEKEGIKKTMCDVFDYLSECLSGRREWYTA